MVGCGSDASGCAVVGTSKSKKSGEVVTGVGGSAICSWAAAERIVTNKMNMTPTSMAREPRAHTVVGDIAQGQRDMLPAAGDLLESVQLEHRPRSGETAGSHQADRRLAFIGRGSVGRHLCRRAAGSDRVRARRRAGALKLQTQASRAQLQAPPQSGQHRLCACAAPTQACR